jgi:hypothetical protein
MTITIVSGGAATIRAVRSIPSSSRLPTATTATSGRSSLSKPEPLALKALPDDLKIGYVEESLPDLFPKFRQVFGNQNPDIHRRGPAIVGVRAVTFTLTRSERQSDSDRVQQ